MIKELSDSFDNNFIYSNNAMLTGSSKRSNPDPLTVSIETNYNHSRYLILILPQSQIVFNIKEFILKRQHLKEELFLKSIMRREN